MKTLSFLLFFCVHFAVVSQTYNRPVPSGLAQYEYANYGFAGAGYFFATPIKLWSYPSDPDYMRPYPAIFDADGYMAWYAQPSTNSVVDFKRYPDTNLYSLTHVDQGNPGFWILDGGLNILDTLHVINHSEDVHDIQLAANGNWILGAAFFDTVDLSAYTFNGTAGSSSTVIKGFGYQEFDPSGTLVGEWNSNDHIHPTETYDYWGYGPNPFDYCHGNAIEEDVDGNLLMSFRHLNAVHKVDRNTGNIIWRLGGQLSDFTFTNDAGFSGQHDIRLLPNGNVTIFDNGNMAATQLSRGLVYELDTVNWTATRVSELIHSTDVFGRSMGNYHTTFDNHEIMGWGRTRRPDPTASIYASNHTLLSEFIFQDSVINYRMQYYDIPNFPRPEITCVEVLGGYELSVPSASEYLWSTGETTQNITLTAAGTYQVWVPYGMGFIGSYPYTVTDISNPCSVGIEELDLENGTFELFDLMGRKVQTPSSHQLYLKVWSNGKTEKIFFTE